MYQTKTFPNGLRLIVVPMPQMKTVASTVFVGVGSRYENKQNNGVAHFLEHLLFKGTKKYPNQAVIGQTIEGIGGQLNAWTSHDFTCYWNKVPVKYLATALEVLAEMTLRSTLKLSVINPERSVIIEEINRYLDTPATQVHSLIQKLLWPNQPLGYDIIGSKKNIQAINRSAIVDYWQKFYQPNNMVISLAGNIKLKQASGLVKKIFNTPTQPMCEFKQVKEQQNKPQILLRYKKTDQAHLCLAVRSLPYNHPQETALALLNTILGQGMSSRLFLQVRTKKSLAYSIFSYNSQFADAGSLVVYAGLNLKKIQEAIKAILLELKKFKQQAVTLVELKKAKEYLKGELLMKMDDTDEMAQWFGLHSLFYPQIKTPVEKLRAIDQVTVDQIKDLAQKLFVNQALNLAVIGPFRSEQKFLEILKV